MSKAALSDVSAASRLNSQHSSLPVQINATTTMFSNNSIIYKAETLPGVGTGVKSSHFYIANNHITALAYNPWFKVVVYATQHSNKIRVLKWPAGVEDQDSSELVIGMQYIL